MIELRNLTVGYGKTPVLRDVSLTIPAGAVTAIVGPNGCGKSTLLKSLPGLSRIFSGQVTVSGVSLSRYTSTALAREIAFLPQTRRVPDMTAEQLVLHGRFPYLRYPRRYRREDWAIAREAMEQTGVSPYAHTPLEQLSGGTRQRVYLAMALAQDTAAVFLDEPNTHLDIASQLQLMELCRDLAARGKAVAVVLHDLNLAMEYAHRIAVLSQGRLLALGTPGEVYQGGALERAFGVEIQRIAVPGGFCYRCLRKKE